MGTGRGTKLYAPSEQAFDEKGSKYSDVYAIGATMKYAATKIAPFMDNKGVSGVQSAMKQVALGTAVLCACRCCCISRHQLVCWGSF